MKYLKVNCLILIKHPLLNLRIMTLQEIVLPQEEIKDFNAEVHIPFITNTPIHIIVPVYNEANSIEKIIFRIHSTLKNRFKYKITVIDDGSSDNTLNLIKKLDNNVNFTQNTKNMGKGKTLKHGFSLVDENEIVVILDGDGEHIPEDIPKLVKPILDGRANHVIGSRFLKKNQEEGRNPAYLHNKKKFKKLRYFGNSMFTLIVQSIYFKKVTDTQSGFRVFGPGIVSYLSMKFSGFEIETEMTLNMIKNKLKIVEVPINSGLSARESHMHIFRDSLRILSVILLMRFFKFKPTKQYFVFQNDIDQLSLCKSQRNWKQEENKQKTSQPSKKISIILPCFNESLTISNVIKEIEDLNLSNYEIIVVDDGSSDNSVDLLKNIPNVKLYVHKENIGYGRALIDGIHKATGDLIITIDSDGQHEPRDIPILCQPVLENKTDIVVGSRYSGQYNYNIPFFNRAGEAFIEGMLYIIFGQTVKNNQGGLRVFHKRTLDIFDNIQFFGMAFTTEIIMNAFLKSYRVIEGPINLYNRPVGKSRVKRIPLLLNLLLCITTYSVKKIRNFVNHK